MKKEEEYCCEDLPWYMSCQGFSECLSWAGDGLLVCWLQIREEAQNELLWQAAIITWIKHWETFITPCWLRIRMLDHGMKWCLTIHFPSWQIPTSEWHVDTLNMSFLFCWSLLNEHKCRRSKQNCVLLTNSKTWSRRSMSEHFKLSPVILNIVSFYFEGPWRNLSLWWIRERFLEASNKLKNNSPI